MAFSNEFVYGYHGCSRDVAEMLLSGKDVSLNSSENDYAVRCPFVEGEPIFPDSKFFDHSHIQISVRNPAAIVELKRGTFI